MQRIVALRQFGTDRGWISVGLGSAGRNCSQCTFAGCSEPCADAPRDEHGDKDTANLRIGPHIFPNSASG